MTDKAAIAGAQAKVATGSVTYTLYTDSKCTKLVGGAVRGRRVIGGVAGPSAAVKPKVGTYYWMATYGGDGLNAPRPANAARRCWSSR